MGTAELDPELLVYDVLTMQQIGLLCPHRFWCNALCVIFDGGVLVFLLWP